jgi:hypothetical protein
MGFFTCIGNHEYDKEYWHSGELYPGGESPIDTAVAAIAELRGRTPYYSKDFGAVRVLFVAANADTTVSVGGDWTQCYHVANPPGRGLSYWQSEGYENGNPDWTNPEFASWSGADTTTGQQAWLKQQCAAHSGTFRLVIGHRSPYTPYADGPGISRPPDRAGRSRGWAVASRAGVDLAVTGDTHTGGLTKRMYRGAQSSIGTHYLSSRIAVNIRPAALGFGANSPSLGDDDMYWPKAVSLADSDEAASTIFGYVEFFGNKARVKLIQGHSDGSFSERASVVITKRRV